MNKIVFFSLLLCISQLINAQNQIKGKVVDQQNEPIVGATVFEAQQNKGTITDIDGLFQLNNIPDGEINIKVSCLGFQNYLEKMFLKDTTVQMNIKLKVAAIETDEVVVAGGYNSTQHENAVKIDIIKPS